MIGAQVSGRAATIIGHTSEGDSIIAASVSPPIAIRSRITASFDWAVLICTELCVMTVFKYMRDNT
jgi:hypothetical protein